MTISVSLPKLLRKASPAFRCGGTTACLLYIFLGGISGLISGLLTLALCWIISFLCDAVVELYEQIERLKKKQEADE